MPDEAIGPGLRFTHGHPLALALVADVLAQRADPAQDLTPGEVADVLPALLERFVTDVPDPYHRTALQILAHSRQTTEALLREVVGEDRAAECFAWLRDLSFVSTGPEGLFPHDLARDVLDHDLRWRDPAAFRDLHRRIRNHVLGRISGSPYFSFDSVTPVWWEPAGSDDVGPILDLVARHEDAAAVGWYRAWWERPEGSFVALRSRRAALHGFSLHLRLDADGGRAAREVGDPVAVADLVAGTAPLRRGQHLLVTRSWMGVDGYHAPTHTFQAVAMSDTALWLTQPDLAVSVVCVSDVPLWRPMFAYIDFAHAPPVDVALHGRRYGAFLHDWRVTSAGAWLELMEPRELGVHDRALELAQRHLRPQPVLALSRTEFGGHVRDALRAACRPAELGRCPLLRSRLLAVAAGAAGATAADLRGVLERGVAAVAADPASARYARVLEVTYLRPAATQEAAAARLSLPFSTYRRHLRAGTEALADVLGDWEVHDEMTPSDPVVP